MPDLSGLNTLAIAASAKHIVELHEPTQLPALLNHCDDPWMVLGGGSNVVFADDFPGTVLLNRILGIELLSQNEDSVIISAGAGEDWHGLVMYALDQGWFGLESLALIPGTVGASPIQNIGAYGVEVNRFIHAVHTYDVLKQCEQVFTAEQCVFEYRNSIFKRNPGRWIITRIDLRLSLTPNVCVTYGALRQRFEGTMPTPHAVAEAVISIRKSKLPDPKKHPNVGSFFKNPILTSKDFSVLQRLWPEVPYFPDSTGVKVPAAALIERAGWKGRGLGSVKMSERHALVLINQGGSGTDVMTLAECIQTAVENQFKVVLEIEPVLVSPSAAI